MAIRAFQGITSEWWIPKSEEGQEDAAEFKLRGMTGAELLEVQQYYDVENSTVSGTGLVLAAKNGLEGWKNIVDEKGNDVVFTRTGLNRLPAETIAEIGGKVINLSVMDEDEAKN